LISDCYRLMFPIRKQTTGPGSMLPGPVFSRST
jgi:hypothetical protein